jgi:hypothetical protein
LGKHTIQGLSALASAKEMAENRKWHACCIMNGMTGFEPAKSFKGAKP